MRDAGTSGNLVEGNVLGLDATGTSGLLNETGIVIAAGASGNTVGGAAAGSGNTIMSSWDDGVALTGQATTGNAVTGNFIGGDSASFILGNRNGVAVRSGAHANTIGGTTPAAKNVIFRNRTDGVVIDGAGTTNIIVEGNDIGANGNGVTVSGGARANTIGGTVAGARNLIWGNLVCGDRSLRHWYERQQRRRQLHRHRQHRHDLPRKPNRCNDQRRRERQHDRWDERRCAQLDLRQRDRRRDQ